MKELQFTDIGYKSIFKKSHGGHYWRFKMFRNGKLSVKLFYYDSRNNVKIEIEELDFFSEQHISILQDKFYDITREEYYRAVTRILRPTQSYTEFFRNELSSQYN